ncbi:MAG: N(G),N(G)-dimethylarginine dimethylaminohydrolase [Chloroflexi bacterium HGW-Chloroflexi-8]|nr:MAG: N(G),N(G)-dimethylarginine dimethylaminohydrolase [Chloroflexi bacterium HGW-Chloroflexi-8]
MHFTHAITRLPADTFSQGISTANLGKPALQKAVEQHEDYVRALQLSGLTCMVLPPAPTFPDSVFVEDTAIVTNNFAVIARPGAQSRLGEIDEMTTILRYHFSKVHQIQEPGTLDGGDVCQVEGHFFIGISARTNQNGANQLAEYLKMHAYSSEIVPICEFSGILHLKSAVNYLGEETLLVDPRLADHSAFQKYRRLVVSLEDAYSANCLRVNEVVLVPSGFPKTLELVQKAGFQTTELDASEYQKMDGGLSCLSLRW